MKQSADQTAKGSQRPLEVLIIDDDDVSVSLVRELITHGCGISANVTHANSMEEASRRLETDGIDLCLADYRLSDASGFRFFAEAGTRAHTAFVFLTDLGRKERVYSALRHGAQDCLRKDRLDPFEMAKSLAFALYHKNREMDLTAAALRDPLTGLGNRALFVEQIEILMAQARRNREQLAVLFMDVDGLKPINDQLGHSVGDQLLKQVAGRIKGSTRESDVLARLGGDEFAAVLPRISSAQTVTQVVQTLVDAVESSPYSIDTHSIRIGLSCGSAIFPTDAQSVDGLLHTADTRMYEMKARRRSAKAAPPAPKTKSAPARQVPLNMSWFGTDTD